MYYIARYTLRTFLLPSTYTVVLTPKVEELYDAASTCTKNPAQMHGFMVGAPTHSADFFANFCRIALSLHLQRCLSLPLRSP